MNFSISHLVFLDALSSLDWIDWKSKLLHEIKPPPEKIHLLCKKLYAGLCSGGGQILTSMITWINTQVDGVPLPLAPLLLVHLQHPPHRQQHARVSWRPWGDVDEDECWPNSTSCLVLCKWGSNDPKIQVELPGFLVLLPIFFVSSHVFLSITVLITVAITIERYQVEKIFFSTSLVIHITVLITCPTIIAIYQIKHVSPSCHIQTNISTVITTTNIAFLNTATTRHFAAQLNIASGPTVPGQLWQDMLALP